MKKIKDVLPHLSMCFSLALIVITIVSVFNPMMGFLNGNTAVYLILITCIITVASSIVTIIRK